MIWIGRIIGPLDRISGRTVTHLEKTHLEIQIHTDHIFVLTSKDIIITSQYFIVVGNPAWKVGGILSFEAVGNYCIFDGSLIIIGADDTRDIPKNRIPSCLEPVYK